MRAFRIVRAPFVDEALLGDGARRDAGRWNPRGVPMVYCAENRALAVLEILVHVTPPSMPDDYRILTIHIPEDVSVKQLDLNALPDDWRSYPAPATLREIGGDWVKESRSCVLVVPSAVLPSEHCVLINPRHAEMARITIENNEAFDFDHRLL